MNEEKVQCVIHVICLPHLCVHTAVPRQPPIRGLVVGLFDGSLLSGMFGCRLLHGSLALLAAVEPSRQHPYLVPRHPPTPLPALLLPFSGAGVLAGVMGLNGVGGGGEGGVFCGFSCPCPFLPKAGGLVGKTGVAVGEGGGEGGEYCGFRCPCPFLPKAGIVDGEGSEGETEGKDSSPRPRVRERCPNPEEEGSGVVIAKLEGPLIVSPLPRPLSPCSPPLPKPENPPWCCFSASALDNARTAKNAAAKLRSCMTVFLVTRCFSRVLDVINYKLLVCILR